MTTRQYMTTADQTRSHAENLSGRASSKIRNALAFKFRNQFQETRDRLYALGMKNGLSKMWAIYKNIAAGRGLLQWVGVWPWLGAAVAAATTRLLAKIRHLDTLEQVVLALVVFAVALVIITSAKLYRSASRSEVPVGGSLGTIRFDYLPVSPLQKGWKKAYKPEGQATFATDHDITDSLRMATQGEFAMDHTVPPHATLAGHLRFTAKYADATMIFAYVVVSTKNGEQRKAVWFKIYYGEARAIRTPGDWHDPQRDLPEQTIYFPAQTLSHGRLMFDIDMREIVRQSIGDQGWIYKGIQKIRLRGDLSISPIEFA